MNEMDKKGSLLSLLLGEPLSKRRAVDSTGGLAEDAALTRHLHGVCSLIENVYGTSDAVHVAVHDLRLVAQLAPCARATTCKRAALLYAAHREPDVRRYFMRTDKNLLAAVKLVTPVFERESCQSPAEYVLMCAVLGEMWVGELG